MTLLRLPCAALSLALLVACKPPAAVAPPLTGQAEASRWPGTQRADFLKGFQEGSGMVGRALKEGRKPWLLKAGDGAAVVRGPLPLRAAPVEPEPRVEVDAATGLAIHYLTLEPGAAFAQGQLAGFQAALALHGPELARRRLLLPRPEPEVPTAWSFWPAGSAPLNLVCGQQTTQVTWTPGLLAWSTTQGGFPPVRRWRSAPVWLRPRYVALQAEVLWVETQSQGALALDLDEGAILAIRPAQAHDPGAASNDMRSYLERERAAMAEPEAVERVAALRQRAEAGEALALYELSRALVEGEEGDPDALCAKTLWLLEAARRGHLPAMMEMASLYFAGRGVPQDLKEARLWSERAARTGNPTAQMAFKTMFP